MVVKDFNFGEFSLSLDAIESLNSPSVKPSSRGSRYSFCKSLVKFHRSMKS